MTSVLELLRLPKTSDAFSALPVVAEVAGSGSSITSSTSHNDNLNFGSPPRKAARLHNGPDTPSASRARTAAATSGPKRVRLDLTEGKHKTPESVHKQELATVSQAVRVLLNRGADSWPWAYDHIYNACRSLVTYHGQGEGLHSNIRLALEQCVSALAKGLDSKQGDEMQWTEAFNETCDWFVKRVSLLKSLLTYLDRVYLLEATKFPNIHDTAYKLFIDNILDQNSISSRVSRCIAEWVTWERKNNVVSDGRKDIQKLVGHLHTFGRYNTIFETAYIEATQRFYASEASKLASDLRGNAVEYLNRIKARLTQEIERGAEVCPADTRNRVVQEVREAFLTPEGIVWLSKEALKSYVPSKDTDEIADMYDLLAKVNGLEVYCAAFKEYIQKSVEGIVKDSAHDEEMVDRLLELKSFANSLVTGALVPRRETFGEPVTKSPVDFAYALREAFQIGFRARRIKPAEMIAKHIDRALKRGQRTASDAEFKSGLDAALGLYRFTDDKDVFRTFYHRLLSKRLLLNRSASDDFEKAVLKTLKEQYDPDFNMGDHMFNDLTLSHELMDEYYSRRTTLENQRLNVMVLQRSFWPFSARKTADIVLPRELAQELDDYNKFYSKVKHQNRKLDFDHALGTATIHGRFKAGAKDLQVSLYQAVILLLFNERKEIAFADIKTATRMDDAELRRTLQSLACGKKKVLRKVPPGRDVEDSDAFVFNEAFTDPRTRVQINSIQSNETPEEAKKTEGLIASERGYTLDAAIVRIMKARRRLPYETLKTATIEAVKVHFVPDVALIKKRISSLVENEYLTRDVDDMNVYIYVA